LSCACDTCVHVYTRCQITHFMKCVLFDLIRSCYAVYSVTGAHVTTVTCLAV